MTMRPRARKLALTAHIASSAGWLGAIVVFLALAIAGLASEDAQMVRAVYLVAEPITWFALVPFAIASLLTGLISSLGTSWGLFRHYWVLFKLALNLFATVILLMHTQTVGHFAGVAAQPGTDLSELKSTTFVVHSSGGLLVLLAAMVLAVYKPRGRTPYGHRKQHERRTALVP
jgi:hypothetical protein